MTGGTFTHVPPLATPLLMKTILLVYLVVTLVLFVCRVINLLLTSATENVWSHYSEKDNRIGSEELGDRDRGDIIADITTSFVILMGIFFPSVTGTCVSQAISSIGTAFYVG